MQDVVPVFRVSSGVSQVLHAFAAGQIRLPIDGDEARIYTINTDMSNRFGAVWRVLGGRGVEHNGR